MDPASDARETNDLSMCAWIGFWAELAVLVVFAVLGTFFASGDGAPGDYACGLILSLAAIVLAFMRLKRRFDGGRAADWGSFLLVDDMANLVAVIVALTPLALAGLFVAARFDHGGLHDFGVALFLATGVAVVFVRQHVFYH